MIVAHNLYFNSVVNLCVTVLLHSPEEDRQVGRNIGGLENVSYLSFLFVILF